MNALRKRVLVLDGGSRTALSVVRSIGQLGIEIGVTSCLQRPIASFSNSCDIFFPSPSQYTDRKRFHGWLRDLVKQWKPDCLLPITDHSLAIITDYYEDYASLTKLPFPLPPSIRTAQDKVELLRLAATLGVRVPSTIDAAGLGEDEIKQLKQSKNGFIIKPRRSHEAGGSNSQQEAVSYFNSGEELLRSVDNGNEVKSLIIQERIIGSGVAVSALYSHGECIATFCHRRILEKPPSGGVSVLSESIAPTDAPVAEALKILNALNWHGVAMVEFKKTNSGKFVLMEVNPRFWGTIQLAIDCGVDIPKLLVAEALDIQLAGASSAGSDSYKVGQRSRWWLGTLDHLIIRTKQQPRALLEVFTVNSLQLFSAFGRTRSAVFRFADPIPGLIEGWNYVVDLWKGFRKK